MRAAIGAAFGFSFDVLQPNRIDEVTGTNPQAPIANARIEHRLSDAPVPHALRFPENASDSIAFALPRERPKPSDEFNRVLSLFDPRELFPKRREFLKRLIAVEAPSLGFDPCRIN